MLLQLDSAEKRVPFFSRVHFFSINSASHRNFPTMKIITFSTAKSRQWRSQTSLQIFFSLLLPSCFGFGHGGRKMCILFSLSLFFFIQHNAYLISSLLARLLIPYYSVPLNDERIFHFELKKEKKFFPLPFLFASWFSKTLLLSSRRIFNSYPWRTHHARTLL